MMMPGRFSFVVFGTEIYMDFEDKDINPMKTRTKIIQARDAHITIGEDFDNTLSYKIDLNVNHAMLFDNPFQSPFEEEQTGDYHYLTVEKYEVVRNTGPISNSTRFAQGSLRLSDTMFLRQRFVYDFVTLVAEVAGFSDLFALGFGFLLGMFYQPYMMEASVLKHMGAVKLPESQNMKEPSKNKNVNPFKYAEAPATLGSKEVLAIFK